jgi:predicted Zn finger-like uncharacterized protein
MRIVCPNCAAEYEVDKTLIPDEGRDVQCSSCGNAWFVAHPDQIAAEESEQSLFDAPESETPQDYARAVPAPSPRQVDQAILDVLREEAARETAQRQDEARPVMESQPDLGLGEPSDGRGNREPETEPDLTDAAPMSAVAERIARLKGQTTEPAAPARTAATQTASKRSDLLPEIDEINSSLRPAAEKRPGNPAAVSNTMPTKGGFSRGFLFGILLWAVLIGAYALAPELAARIPALAPVLDAFVSFVDGVRTSIARMGSQLVDMLGRLSQ